MVSPHVAAPVGLLASRGANGEIHPRILYTAADLGFAGPDPYYGYGRIHADSAVR